MSAFLGDLWTSVNRFASQARMNLKTNLVGTGDQILAKSTGSLIEGMVASVTTDSTGGALKKGIHRWDGSQWVSPQGGIHYHSSVSDGGTFQDIMIKAIQNTWFANPSGAVTKERFHQTGNGATYSNIVSGTNSYVEINTNTIVAYAGNLRYGGFEYNFAFDSAFITRIQLADTTTNSQARCGMNMEVAEAVTDNKVKYGFEGCSTCNSSSISIISADGTTRSKNTTSSDSYANTENYQMRHDPGVNIKWARGTTGTIITKTNTIPASGLPDRSNAWLCGIQTTDTTNKILRLYAFQGAGTLGGTIPTIP